MATELEEEEYGNSLRSIASALLEGQLIPFLGAGVNLADRAKGYQWTVKSPDSLPSGGELATYIAGQAEDEDSTSCAAHMCLQSIKDCRVEACPARPGSVKRKPVSCPLTTQGLDLAKVAQFVVTMEDEKKLYTMLRPVFSRAYAPTASHRHLASLAAALGKRQGKERYPLIVTSNYDDLMEKALGEHTPFDLVFYEAYGENKGSFFHRKPDSTRVTKLSPRSKYLFFDSCPLVLKIHGNAASDRTDAYSYMITEDDYIEYIANGVFEKFLPATILGRLRESRLLFLGYSLRDWNLRVFLRRITKSQRLRKQHWAVAIGLSAVEQKFWKIDTDRVDIIDKPIAEFIGHLEAEVRDQLDRASRA
jgi:SIR2-like domain